MTDHRQLYARIWVEAFAECGLCEWRAHDSSGRHWKLRELMDQHLQQQHQHLSVSVLPASQKVS